MKSNKYFSFRRFYLLLQNDMLINYKNYLLTALGAFLILFVALYWQMSRENLQRHFEHYQYLQNFLVSLLFFGMFVGLAFPDLENKIKTSNYLLLPTSMLEKFLAQFLIRVIVGSFVFGVIFWSDTQVARFFTLSVLNGYTPIHTIDSFNSTLFVRSVFEHASTLAPKLAIVLGVFSLGMFLFSVRLFFNRFALIKTIISLVVLLYFNYCSLIIFSHLFYPETVGFKVNMDFYNVTPSLNNYSIWVFLISYLSWFFLLLLGYYKLKEKQV